MGDIRYLPPLRRVRDAEDPARAIRALTDEEVVSALAAASQEGDPYLSNVLATEAHNRTRRNRAISHNLGEGVVALDARGRVTFVNPAAEALLGWDADALAGRDFHDTVHSPPGTGRPPLTREHCPILEALTTGETARLDEETLTRRDGTTFPAALTASAVVHEDEVEGVVVVFRDVTARVASERRRGVRVAITEIVAEADGLDGAAPRVLAALGGGLGWAAGAMWRPDAPGGVLRCAEAWSRPELEGSPFMDETRRATFAPGEGLPGRVWARGAPAWVTDVADDGNFPRGAAARAEGLHGAFAFPIHSDGSVIAVAEFFNREVLPPDEDLLEMVGTVGSQLGQFAQRRRAERELAVSEARKAAILEAALDAIVTMDHEGRVVEWNPAAEATFGYSRDEAVGREMADLIVPERLREAHRAGLRRYLATGVGRVVGRHLELPAVRRDGREFPAEVAILPMAGEGPPLFTGFIRDITGRKRAKGVIEARVRQQEAVAALGQEALENPPLDALFQNATEVVADTLGVEYCKVLELLPRGDALLLRAGVGWREGLVGAGTVGAGLDSQAGYTLRSDDPVIVEDLREETRFSGPPLLRDHGVVSGISVVIRGAGERPWGVMGAHTTQRRAFTRHDVNFLQAVANVLAAAIQRREAGRALAESEQRHRSLFEHNPDAVFSLDTNGVFRTANAGCARLSGYGRDELVGTPFTRYLVDEEVEPVTARFLKVLKGTPQAFGTTIVHRDGRRVEVHATGVPIVVDREIVGAYGIAKDITRRRQAERALAESEQRYRRLFESIDDAILVTDTTRGITDCNTAFTRLMGYDLDEVRGASTAILYPSHDAYAGVGRAINGHGGSGPVVHRTQLAAKSGRVFPAELTISALTDEAGAVHGYIGIIRPQADG